MARFVSITVRLDKEDVQALKRARAEGLSASNLIRKGRRVVASRYHLGGGPPTRLFESTNSKPGDEIRAVSGYRGLIPPVIADTGALLRALACGRYGRGVGGAPPRLPDSADRRDLAAIRVGPGLSRPLELLPMRREGK